MKETLRHAAFVGLCVAVALSACVPSYVTPTADDSGSTVGADGSVADGTVADAVTEAQIEVDGTGTPVDASSDAYSAGDVIGQGSLNDSGPAAPGQLSWGHQLGVFGSWEGREALALDTNSVIATTTFVGTVNLGGKDLVAAGMNDVILARFAKADGSHLASVSYGGPGSEYPFATAVASDGTVFVQGIFTGGTANLGGADIAWGGTGNNTFMADFTSALAPKWSRGIVSADDDQPGRTVSFDSQSIISTSGKFRLTTDFGGGSVVCDGDSDAYYAQYDKNNNLNAFFQLAGPSYEYAEAAIYSLGSTVVGGEFTGTIALNGANDAGNLSSAGGMDIFVAEFDAGGTPTWVFTVGGLGDESDVRLAGDSAGHVYVAGTFQQTVTIAGKTLTSMGGTDVFLARLSATGGVDWVRSFGGAGNDMAWKLAASPSGDLAMAGNFFSSVDFGGGVRTSAGGKDIFVTAYNGADGTYRWDHAFGGSTDDWGQSVAIDTDGTVYALATFSKPVTVGAKLLDPANGDSVLLRFSK
jgi:hypothetical protein